MKDLFSVKDKVVLITGGSGGIGSALVKGFVEAGATVSNFDKHTPQSKAAEYYKVNLSNRDELMEAWEKFIKKNKRIDVLITCAAVTCPRTLVEYPLSAWENTLAITLDAVFNICQQAGLQMIEQGEGGSIINFTSINAAVAMPNNPSYAAAKAGVRQLTKSFALDWGKHRIRVNNLGPGYTATQMNMQSLNDPAARKFRADKSMLGRWAQPEEMVGPAIFLASDASSFITGTDLWVDGGWLSKGM